MKHIPYLIIIGVLIGLTFVMATNVINESIPAELFDITWNLEDSFLESSSELEGVITFESFGRVPTPVDLEFIVLDSGGSQIYFAESDIVVEVEEVRRWKFEELQELSSGKYTAVLRTVYNVDVFDEFKQEFEVIAPKKSSNLFIWYIAGGLIVLGIIIFILIKFLRKKK